MISIVPTLPLETFRELLGFNPFWFWGMSDLSEQLRPGAQPGLQGCRGVTKEFAWQDRDQAGRNEIREAIARAERKMEEHLNFFPAPVYREQTIEWPRLGDRRFVRGGPYDADDRWLNVKLENKWVQSAGVEARTVISSGQAVTYSDTDLDTYDDLATIGPIATSLTDPREIAVYFVSGDRYGADNSISERWRIAPVSIDISGGFLTIRVPAWIMVRPILQAGLLAPDIDPKGTPSPYAQTVDVYRRYTETNNTDVNTSQAVIIWETRPSHGWWCVCGSCSNTAASYGGSPYDPAAIARAVARVGIRDGENGIVTPSEALYNTTDGTWAATNWWVCEEPDRVTVRYLSGYPLDSDGQMNDRFREIVTILAAAELGRPISGCADANRLLFYWQQDLAKIGNDKEQYATSAAILNNPFGSRRGHVEAWRRVQNLEVGLGLRVG